MNQVWRYDTSTGEHHGIFLRFSDFGGNDVTYTFHRLGSDGMPIVHDNGGRTVDCVGGSMLKKARRVGAVNPGSPWLGQ